MKLYVVRNKEGKYFRPIGQGGHGSNWNDSMEKAKFYTKIGQAKSQITFWYNAYPTYGCPDLLEFDLDAANAVVIDMKQETEKKGLAKQKLLLKRKEQAKFREIQYLEQQKQTLQTKLNALNK